jgi:hypothetical protein
MAMDVSVSLRYLEIGYPVYAPSMCIHLSSDSYQPAFVSLCSLAWLDASERRGTITWLDSDQQCGNCLFPASLSQIAALGSTPVSYADIPVSYPFFDLLTHSGSPLLDFHMISSVLSLRIHHLASDRLAARHKYSAGSRPSIVIRLRTTLLGC